MISPSLPSISASFPGKLAFHWFGSVGLGWVWFDRLFCFSGFSWCACFWTGEIWFSSCSSNLGFCLMNARGPSTKLTSKNGSWCFRSYLDFWKLTLLLWISDLLGIVLCWNLFLIRCFHRLVSEIWDFEMRFLPAIITMRLGIDGYRFEVFLHFLFLLFITLVSLFMLSVSFNCYP